MPSEGDQRKQTTAKPHPAEPENLPCPRCESTNTKFCYYNNYNLSQPRYFCKACRRYWTRGGTLRNVPVGGGSRKNTKRSRPSSVVSTTPIPTPPPQPLPTIINTTSSFESTEPIAPMINLNVSDATSFMSLLTANNIVDTGLGYGFGQVDSGVGYGFDSVCGSDNSMPMMMMDGGDCLTWPELAISMPSVKVDLELE